MQSQVGFETPFVEEPWKIPRGQTSLESSQYMRMATLICFRLLEQAVRLALSLAALSAESSNAARMPMMAITTSISIKVKAFTNLMVSFTGSRWLFTSTLATNRVTRCKSAGRFSLFIYNVDQELTSVIY